MRTLSLSRTLRSFSFTAVLLAVSLMATNAFATDPGLSDVTKNVGRNVLKSVPLIPMVSYVCGVFFTASGLLKLKDWVNDGERNSIIPAIMRLVVAAFLIILPHMIRMVTGTLFGRKQADGTVQTYTNVKTPAPELGAFQKSR